MLEHLQKGEGRDVDLLTSVREWAIHSGLLLAHTATFLGLIENCLEIH
jgi:hypothetical protein